MSEFNPDLQGDKIIEVQTEKQFKSDPEKLRSYERIKALELAIEWDPNMRVVETTIKIASKFYQFLSGKDKAYYQPATQKQINFLRALVERSKWENDIDYNELSRGEAKEKIQDLIDNQLEPIKWEHDERKNTVWKKHGLDAEFINRIEREQ